MFKWLNFLVIKQLTGRFQVVKIRLNFSSKKIKVKENYFVKDVFQIKKPPRWQPWQKIDRLILILDSKNAATVQSAVSLRRTSPQAALNENELDHLIFKAFWEFLNRYRNWSAKKLGLRDSELVLADIGILGLALGGKNILNPFGLRGADFVVNLKGTFVSRTILPWLDDHFRDRCKEFFIIENGGLFYDFLSLKTPHLVLSNEERTDVFRLKKAETLFLKTIDWGYLNVLREFESLLGIDETTARNLMNHYFQDLISDRAKRLFNQIWQKQFEKFFRQLGDLAAVFVINWPQQLIRQPFSAHHQLKKEGFEIKGPLVGQEIFASLVDNYSRPEYNYLNQMLKRRARWLIPNL